MKPSSAPLPGLEPGYVRLELTRQDDGRWRLEVAAAESRGFIAAASIDRYDDLALYEAADVAGACLDGLLPLSGP